ncbi:MAG TPA: glycosyltransferase family 4 protein, partial [Blastocatellia bacterium]|nr:glycosyltransferase family 4 protein [Blastocatellia bacterium]
SAMRWAAAELPGVDIRLLNKADLKWASKRDALRRVRSLGPDVFCVFTSDLRMQSGRGALMLFAIFAGAHRVIIGDSTGRDADRSRLGVLLFEAPRLALELLIGYGVIVPLSWLLTEALRVSLVFGGTVRASRTRRGSRDFERRNRSFTALYIRATLTGAAVGGMPTHVAGFAGGAAALGHRIKFLASGSQDVAGESILISPSQLFSATRALFELWNNLIFTLKSLRTLADGQVRQNEIDFIYQRYSRFNWTGVMLSAVTGLPFVLEFNGSEVWVSRQWDPIGLAWLLKRFERLNLRAADLIFVVSEVERRNLISSNVISSKVIVNPNGVDTERFRPECGGREIRRALSIEQETVVVGFVGTFGPWHGAPLLAEAATRINEPPARCYFLFIGAGEQQDTAESIIDSASKRVLATFTGRMDHSLVPAHLDACDILVVPTVPAIDGSQFFGSPTKMFEYMAMARPVIASRLGQIEEVIEDGKNGLLVEPGDVDALRRAIEKLAVDGNLRSRLGAEARKKAIERYTWRHNAARVFDAVQARIHQNLSEL